MSERIGVNKIQKPIARTARTSWLDSGKGRRELRDRLQTIPVVRDRRKTESRPAHAGKDRCGLRPRRFRTSGSHAAEGDAHGKACCGSPFPPPLEVKRRNTYKTPIFQPSLRDQGDPFQSRNNRQRDRIAVKRIRVLLIAPGQPSSSLAVQRPSTKHTVLDSLPGISDHAWKTRLWRFHPSADGFGTPPVDDIGRRQRR